MENNLDLLLQAKKGDDSAKEKLVEQNLGLVWSVARRFTGRGYDIEDLFQIGCIGLIKSIDKFDFDYDVKFSTYAVPLIQGEIRRFLRDYGAIKVSRSLKEMNSKVEQYRQRVIKEKGYEPEIEEIAAALSYDAGEIVMAMARSIDELNVQVVMEKMGGGGHITSAGAQLENCTLEEGAEQIKQILTKMKEEGDI